MGVFSSGLGELGTWGAVTFPFIFFLLLLFSAGMGILSLHGDLAHQWALQRDLDGKVAAETHWIRGEVRKIEGLNSAMEGLRVSLAVALEPETRMALRAALRGVVFSQETQRYLWLAHQGRWFTMGSYPAFPWVRPPADLLGEKPLQWRVKKKS